MKNKFTPHFLLQQFSLKTFGLAVTVVSLFLLSFQSNAQTTTISVPGQTNARTIFVYAPSGIAQNRPLVISMHGLNQDINYQKGQAKWEQVADTAKFVVVYPAGEGNSWDINGTKDTDFILAIIESMVTRYGIDRNRVYVSGFSMGGMNCYNVANKIANKIAAIGPVSGYLFGNTVASSRPMPIIHVHGNADDVVHYEPYQNQQGVVAMLKKWRDWNQCPSSGTRTTPYPVNKPNSKSIREYWGPCNNSEVELITLDGKGHWHSNDDAAGVHTTRELWRFFKKQSLSTGPVITLTSPAVTATFMAPATINLAATATVSGGTISNVRFYNGTTLLNTDNTSPFSYSWTNVAAGTYSVRAVATDNQGRMAEVTQTVKVNVPQGPYNTTSHTIPGKIQIEEFDLGGNGVAYSDASAGNTGGATFRTDEDVDLETCTDAGGGYNLGFATAGEWLEYTVNVTASGNYDLDLRVACNGTGRTVSVNMDGTTIANNVAIPNTGAWQTWQTVTVKNVPLTTGQKVMRITVGATDYVNINYVTFSSIITGLGDESTSGVSTVFPNPFKENFVIDVQGEFSYKLSNMSGVIVEEGTSQGRTELAGQYPKGVYMLKLTKADKSTVVKMIKE